MNRPMSGPIKSLSGPLELFENACGMSINDKPDQFENEIESDIDESPIHQVRKCIHNLSNNLISRGF